jgi:hypothetical protein
MRIKYLIQFELYLVQKYKYSFTSLSILLLNLFLNILFHLVNSVLYVHKNNKYLIIPCL